MVVQTFETVDEILWSDHSNETSPAVLSHGNICFVGFENKKLGFFLLWPPLGVKGLTIHAQVSINYRLNSY